MDVAPVLPGRYAASRRWHLTVDARSDHEPGPLARLDRAHGQELPLYLLVARPRWLAYQNQGALGVFLEPWPSGDRRFELDATGADPQWRSATELVYFRGEVTGTIGAFYRIRVHPGENPPFGEPVLWISDPLFTETAGPSFHFTADGDLVYLRSPAENRGYYVRIIRGWVADMKRAVDQAIR